MTRGFGFFGADVRLFERFSDCIISLDELDVRQKMRNLIPLLILFACNSVGVADERAPKPVKTDAPTSIISLHELLEKRSKFKGKKVTIAAYFVTHPDGPWICGENGDWKKRLETTLSIKNVGAAKLKALDSTRDSVAKKLGFDKRDKPLPDKMFETLTLYYSQFSEGTPALITGTFEVGDYSYLSNGLDLKDHPFMTLIEIREVKANDPRWKAAQTKGEQGGARQPTTAPDSKSEGSEKTKPESEGRSQ